MHLACAKLDLLRGLELEDRVSILLNRSERSHRGIPASDIERIFRKEIFFTLPNAYEETRQAGIAGRSVSAKSELGVAFERLARKITNTEEKEPGRRGGLLDSLRAFRGSSKPALVGAT